MIADRKLPFGAVLAALAVLGVAGCSKPVETKAAHAAGGEVLPGTVSDAMLDPEHTRTEPPLQAVRIKAPKLDEATAAAEDDTANTAGAAPAAPAAAEPN